MKPNTPNTKMTTFWMLFASMMTVVASQAFAQDSGSQEIRFGVMHVGSQTMRVNAVNTNNPGTAPVSVRLRILDSTGKIVQELVTNLPTAQVPAGGEAACPNGCQDSGQVASVEFTPERSTALYATVLVRGSHPDTDYIRATCEIVVRKGNDEQTIALYPGVAVPCDSVPCTQ